MGDVGVPRLSAERLEEELAKFPDGDPIIALVRELEAELVVVRERAERLEQFVRDARPLLGMAVANSLGARADALLVEQEKEQP